MNDVASPATTINSLTVPPPPVIVNSAPAPPILLNTEQPRQPTAPVARPVEAESDAAWSSGEIDKITSFGASVIGDVPINRVEVLSNRLVPGSDGSIEHVVLTNHAITVIRSTPLKGRVRVAKNNVYVGGVSCKVLLTGLEARVETVRHLVGGDSLVYGALFLSKQRKTPLKKFGTVSIGSPRTVVQALTEAHCSVPPSPYLKALTAELDGIFLPYDKLTGQSASGSDWAHGEWS